MTSPIRRRTVLKAGLATGALVAAPWVARAAQPLKVGFVYPSPINDFGWSYRHEIGRQQLVEALGDRIETTFVANVAEGPDSERVIRRLARSGHKLIFTCSFGYMDPTIRVAERFPDVLFENNTGYKTADNVSAYNARFHEARTVFGVIAAHQSKTGIIGCIASFPIPEVVMSINALALSARKIRPDMKVRVIWVNKWYDPGLEADAAKTHIAQGADILTQITNSTAPTQVAEENGIHSFGQDNDMSAFGPTAHMTGVVNNWGPYYIRRVRDALEGSWQSRSSWDGFAEDVVQLAPYNQNLPPEVVEAAEGTRKAIMSGDLHPFAGPIVNRDGGEVIPEGTALEDKAIHSMNWFVSGVEGDLPS